jgi:hypothetical protein
VKSVFKCVLANVNRSESSLIFFVLSVFDSRTYIDAVHMKKSDARRMTGDDDPVTEGDSIRSIFVLLCD